MSGTPTVMVNREILDPKQVNYFTPGTLKAYLEQVAAAQAGATPAPSATKLVRKAGGDGNEEPSGS